MPHDQFKTPRWALFAVFLMVISMPLAHATPIRIEVTPMEFYEPSSAEEPQYEHLLGDDEGYDRSAWSDPYVSIQCETGSNGSCFDNVNVVSVPEPGTMLLFATGLFLLTLSERRRRIFAKQ